MEGVMRITRKITAGAGVGAMALGLGLGTTAVSAPVASASSVPVVYATFGHFKSPTIRFRVMGLGALWGVNHASWKHWSSVSAYGRAREYVAASESGPEYKWKVHVTFSNVKRHNGRAYYSRMKITGTPPAGTGISHVQHLAYRYNGWFQV
jgi:hypothetical protein